MYGIRGPDAVKFFSWAAGLTFMGAQSVHAYYQPMLQLDELVEIELERLRKEDALKKAKSKAKS